MKTDVLVIGAGLTDNRTMLFNEEENFIIEHYYSPAGFLRKEQGLIGVKPQLMLTDFHGACQNIDRTYPKKYPGSYRTILELLCMQAYSMNMQDLTLSAPFLHFFLILDRNRINRMAPC